MEKKNSMENDTIVIRIVIEQMNAKRNLGLKSQMKEVWEQIF